ncbi:transcriptional regulator [Streptomyces pharetrae CZA14]|uniref:Transcriptional regulator n=1 Tax=Streptomyces pharetrae CZA14 TaxID=1144883 RepID=A0ABX3YJV8_9ACTN|nr:transcriptional regulator [Streptomyces pharetrae CZA14]
MCSVPIDSLVITDSPRLQGEDSEHIQLMAETGEDLPPIWVHQPSRKVIDGVHRVRAAVIRGKADIDVRFFHGSEADVFLLAVFANTKHGLPLSQEDRVAAARRVFTTHPEWSDRMVASLTGLSPRRVATMRGQLMPGAPQPTRRIGRDGRSRPVDSAQGRQRAAELIRENPAASLRQIARAVGISPATVADVRNRLDRGDLPVPQGALPEKVREHILAGASAEGRSLEKDRAADPDLSSIFDRLRRDPSLRFSDTGRTLLRMFDSVRVALREQEEVLRSLPPHCRTIMAELSCGYAQALQTFGEELKVAQQTGAGLPRASAG